MIKIFSFGMIIGVMLGAIFSVVSLSSESVSLPPDQQVTRDGSTLVAITAGTNSGTATASFSPAFPTGTTSIKLSYYQLNPNILPIPAPSGILPFLSVNVPVVWTNMPTTANNEIFGNTNDEIIADLSTVSYATFSVNIVAASNNATGNPFLRPEYNVGSGWVELASSTTSLDISILFAGLTQSVVQTNIANAAKTISTELRVAGFYGGGVGDVPSFSQIQLTFYTNFASMQASFGVCAVTSCPLTLYVAVKISSSTSVTVTWRAVGCVKGAIAC